MSPQGLELPAGGHVPDLDRVFRSPRHQAPAVGAERELKGHLADQRVDGTARLLLLSPTGRVPEFHRPVGARRGQVPAVAAESQPLDLPVVGAEYADLTAGPRVPDPHL